jgi:hypothetical protein
MMSAPYRVDRMLLNNPRNELYDTEPGLRLFYYLISGVYSAVMRRSRRKLGCRGKKIKRDSALMEDAVQNDSMFCDIGAEHILPVFPDSSRSCVEVWNDKLKKGALSCIHFKEHWRIWVP